MSIKIKSPRFIAPLVFLLILVSSCTKVGPAGAPGPQGPAGAQGPEGNANAQTVIFPTTSANWGNSFGNWVVTLSIPQLTQSIIDKGSVTVYWGQNSNSTSLPFALGPIDYMYYITLGQINIQVTQAGSYLFSNPATLSPVTFKVEIIPGQ
jgi:hypothetical protein